MKALWVRLSLAFGGMIMLSVIGIATTAILVLRLSGLPFPPLVVERLPGSNTITLAPPTLEQAQQFHDQALARLSGDLLRLALFCGVVGVAAGVTISRKMASPMHDLAEAARAIGNGDLGRRVNVKGAQEFVDLGQAFNQMASDLERAADLRRNLMADVAHELRTPLTVLLGNLRAILDDVYVMDKEEVARLYDQTRHLTQLVEDLRVVALAEARQLPLNLAEIDAIPLLSEVCLSFEPIAAEKGVRLALDLSESPLNVRVDAARLKQVLYNLLSNALRHTPGGGLITITTTQSAESGDITIADTGEGISIEHLGHVFDRFYRTDPARARDTGGTGLGLAIAKAIVEAHSGQVSVASDGPGRGAAFGIRLPLAAG